MSGAARAVAQSVAYEIPLLLAVLKNVRLFQRPGYHADSAEDAVAYGALLAEAKARELEQPAAVPYIGPDRRACGNDLDDMVRAGKSVLPEDCGACGNVGREA